MKQTNEGLHSGGGVELGLAEVYQKETQKTFPKEEQVWGNNMELKGAWPYRGQADKENEWLG